MLKKLLLNIIIIFSRKQLCKYMYISYDYYSDN